MKLKELLTSIPFYVSDQTIEDISIRSIQMNHQYIKKNDMFVCICGEKADGHSFVERAIENGAAVIVAEKKINVKDVAVIYVNDTMKALAQLACKFYHFPSNHLYMMAITGTNGKTTTTYILEHILTVAKYNVAQIGTIQLKYRNITKQLENTTPNALELQRYLSLMKEEGITDVVMEASSHGIQLGRLYGCRFAVVVFTNLTQDHLDFHETMDAYALSKSLLFSRLGNEYVNESRFAVINRDDPYYRYFSQMTAQPIVTFGFHPKADVCVEKVDYSMDGTNIHICTPKGLMNVSTQLIGKFNVYNTLAAITAAMVKGIPLKQIEKALTTCFSPPGRFERVEEGQSFYVLIDYAHTPDSLENILTTVRALSDEPIILVVGAGGNRDKTKRPQMGEIALKNSQHVIFTSDNPRYEDPSMIIDEMIGQTKKTNYMKIINRQEAIFQAINMAKKNDIIIIAGKGHEHYQEINGERFPFNDKHIVKQAILHYQKPK